MLYLPVHAKVSYLRSKKLPASGASPPSPGSRCVTCTPNACYSPPNPGRLDKTLTRMIIGMKTLMQKYLFEHYINKLGYHRDSARCG